MGAGVRRVPRRLVVGLVITVIAVLIIAAVAVYLGFGTSTGSAAHRTAASRAAAAVPTPSPSPVLVPADGQAPVPTDAGLAAALRSALHAPALGGSLAYDITDVATDKQLLAGAATTLHTPASVTKLTTATAVLASAGPQARIPTTVVAGAKPGEVVLVGHGDPTLSVGAKQTYPGAARLEQLAAQVKKASPAPVTKVVVDDSAYSGPVLGPGWDSDLVGGGDVAPITPVMVDGGRLRPDQRARTSSPDLAAGQELGRLLGAPNASVVHGSAPAGARVLGTVRSAPISTLVEQCLQKSDNVLAEALARQVAIARHQPASFAGAVAAVRAQLRGLGIDLAGLHLVDGSGLSRQDRLSPALLVDVLQTVASAKHPQLRSVLTGLPVAGYSGTLEDRYRGAVTAAGEVRAKTGTLSGVSTLAGVVTDADGRLLAFALLANQVPVGGTFAAEDALDAIAGTLAGCGCR